MKLFATITDREELISKATSPVTGAGFPRSLAEIATSLEIWKTQEDDAVITEFFLLDAQDAFLGSSRIEERTGATITSRIMEQSDGQIDTSREEESFESFGVVSLLPGIVHAPQLPQLTC